MDEFDVLSHLRTAWSLYGAYSLTEQLGIATLAAAGLYGAAVGAARAALRGWRLAGGVAGAARRLWRWVRPDLPVRDLVAGLCESMRDPLAWECAGKLGVRHILNANVVVCYLLVQVGGSDLYPDLNGRERKVLDAARVRLRATLDAQALADRMKKAARTVGELKV